MSCGLLGSAGGIWETGDNGRVAMECATWGIWGWMARNKMAYAKLTLLANSDIATRPTGTMVMC